MCRNHDRDMMIGVAGILAGATLTVAGHDFMMSRTGNASAADLALEMRDALGLEIAMPEFEEGSAIGITWRVFKDVSGMVAGTEEEEDKA